MGGVRFSPNDHWDLGLNLTWTSSDAKMDSFDLSADDYAATHPSTVWDFSQTPGYSKIDVSRIDVDFTVNYHINKTFFVGGRYRYADYDDNHPYLYDTSGTINILYGYLGWTF